MAIEHDLNRPKATAGPTIDGQPTTISVFSAQQLRYSDYLPGLFETINLAYEQSHASQPKLGFKKAARLSSIDEVFTNLTKDPESFLIVVSHPDNLDVISTATCRRYLGPKDTSPWSCSHEVAADTEEWELKLLATHPSYQGKGVGGLAMKIAEQEIATRFSQKQNVAGREGVRQARLVLCTVQELFSDFYHRKGYQEMYTHERGEGFSFHIEFMFKVLNSLP